MDTELLQKKNNEIRDKKNIIKCAMTFHLNIYSRLIKERVKNNEKTEINTILKLYWKKATLDRKNEHKYTKIKKSSGLDVT